MEHVLVAESIREGQRHLFDMHPFFFRVGMVTNSNRYEILLHTGRVDTIRIITHESNIMGHRFDGIVFRTNNSSALDSLYYRVKHWRPPNREINHAENLFWHWSEEDSIYRTPRNDHALARTIVDELEAEKWSRNRG